MPPANPIRLTLDRPREVRWTKRAEARNASLPRPVSFAQLARGKKRLFVLCALVWSALVDRDHDYESPEDLAEFFTTEEQQVAALAAIRAMLDEAFPEKKSPLNDASSQPGPALLSNAASAPPPSIGGA